MVQQQLNSRSDADTATRRVVIVEDSLIIRERLAAGFAGSPISLVGEAGEVAEALVLINRTGPDAVLLDLSLRGDSGIALLEHFQHADPRPAFVVFTNYPLEEYRRRCMALGASAFLDKSSDFDRVIPALLDAAAGDTAPEEGDLMRYAAAANEAALRVLLVEDSDADARLVVEMLRDTGAWIEVERAERISGALERISRDGVDVLLLDVQLPDAQGLEGLGRIRGAAPELPVVIVSGIGDEALAAQAVGAGAQDYLIKGTFDGRALARVICYARERRRAEQALLESEQRYRLLAEATSDAILVFEDGIIREINRPVAEVFGYQASEVIGRPALEFVAPGSRAVAAANIASGFEGTTEMRLLAKDGQEREVVATARMQRAGGRTLRLLAVRDLTEQRRLEGQVQRAQRMDALERLARVVAHDFNNVLTAISGCTELALGTLPGEHEARADLEAAQRATRQGAELANQLLAFSRPQIVGAATADVHAILAADQRLLERVVGADVVLAVRTRASRALVGLADQQVRQIVMNLAINARDAMPDGGALVIETSDFSLDAGAIATSLAPGAYLRLTVSDTGAGMDAAVQARIFEPFFTTKGERGTGLGLASVYGLATHAGGSVGVTSVPGRGTTFELLLPVVPTAGGE